MTIPVIAGESSAEEVAEREYTVRLYFAESSETQPGTRVFDLVIQGQAVAEDFDVIDEAGGAKRSVVAEFGGIRALRDIEINLLPKQGVPLICGVELVVEE